MKTPFYLFFIASLCAQLSFSQSHYQRLIVFGDSLSDVGTYSKRAGIMGGGKFTTNPGKIWIELVAQSVGLPLQPNRYEGLGTPLYIVGGFDYAQGGARVVLERGQIENDVEGLGISARPLVQQVQYFLQQHKQFKPTDLVSIQGGANDIFAQMYQVQTRQITIETAIKNVILAASQLNELIQTLHKNGAGSIIVLSVPYIQKTPFILGMNPQIQTVVDKLVVVFNSQLLAGTRALGIRMIDLTVLEKTVNQNAFQYGFKNITQTACSLRFLPGNSALYCNPKNFVTPDADKTYKYADLVHPTTGFSSVMGQFILKELGKR